MVLLCCDMKRAMETMHYKFFPSKLHLRYAYSWHRILLRKSKTLKLWVKRCCVIPKYSHLLFDLNLLYPREKRTIWYQSTHFSIYCIDLEVVRLTLLSYKKLYILVFILNIYCLFKERKLYIPRMHSVNYIMYNWMLWGKRCCVII